jgi:hypothetical protein
MKFAFTILIFLLGILILTCGCSQQQGVNNVTATVTTASTTAPTTTPSYSTVTETPMKIPYVTITVTDTSVKKFPDYCLWTFAGTLSNMGTGRLNEVSMIVTLTDRTAQYPTITNQQQIGTVNPGSDQQFWLTATAQCFGDYHASLKYYGRDDAGKLYSGAKNL